ncbi:MAG TPA: ATP-binding protein [Mucilaginibacter sp.]|jgi:signal transduction histidine kinase|nr:ATP-binding protein [Mucilaginibacter sp.]
MLQQDHALILLIIGGTIILLLLGIFIIGFLFFYQRKHNKHLTEKQILQSHFQQTLLQTQLEIREQTMQSIGADLHDNIGQLLSLTSLTLNSVKLSDAEKAKQKIDSALELTVRSIKEMRLLGKLLQGEQLISLGLGEAIRQEIAWIEKSGQFIVNYNIEDGQLPQPNPDKDLILFRMLQEILNNIIKHSKATEINIKLLNSEGGVGLKVIDNGMGFDINHLLEEQKGMGLMNIQKRAELVGGEVFIQSQLREGTFIDIFIPYP